MHFAIVSTLLTPILASAYDQSHSPIVRRDPRPYPHPAKKKKKKKKNNGNNNGNNGTATNGNATNGTATTGNTSNASANTATGGNVQNTATALTVAPLPGAQANTNPPDTPPALSMNQVVNNALQRPPAGPNFSVPPPVANLQSIQQIQQMLAGAGYGPVQGVDGATACNEFVGYFSTVSAAINSMFTAQDPSTIQRRAAMAFMAENNEAFAVSNMLNIAAQNPNPQIQQQALNAMQLIILNTPNVLNGLQAIYQNPTPQNAAAQAQAMSMVRNQNILPSIADMCQASMVTDGSVQYFALNAQIGAQQPMYCTRTFLPQGANGNIGFNAQGQAVTGGFNPPQVNVPANGPIMQTVAGGPQRAQTLQAIPQPVTQGN